MNDLISRKALLKAMEKKYDIANETGMYPNGLSEAFIITEKIIQEQPTAYDVDKVVDEIMKEAFVENNPVYAGKNVIDRMVSENEVIKIVKGGLEE